MGATELAAWWGAIVATGVAIWDVVKWKRRNTPRLKIETRQNEDDEFVVKIANIGEVPALIEEVRFICFARHRFFFRKQIELEPRFSLFGDSGSPPVTLASGEPWEIYTVLDHVEKYHPQLDTLMTEDFHIFHPQDYPECCAASTV